MAPAFIPGSDPLAVAPAAIATMAAQLTGFVPSLATYDPKVAQALCDHHLPRLQAIPPDRVKIPRLDIDPVCGALLSAHALTQHPTLLGFYKGAATQGEFELGNIDLLKELSFVLLHLFRKAEAAGAFATKAKISATLDKSSDDVETRIQRVCEHFFSGHPDIGRILVRLSPGTSYLDRAHDLLGYADIYEANLAVVSTDPVHFLETDLADARQYAAEILAAISSSMTPQALEAFDGMRRAWTLIDRVYAEVRELGLRFLRHDPKRDTRFPSLYSVGRRGQGRRKKNKNEAEAGKPEGE